MSVLHVIDGKGEKEASEPVMTLEPYTFRQFHIPVRMLDGITRYIEKGIAPGGFLTAIIQNDMRKAVSLADSENLVNLPAYAGYLENEAPSGCYGSVEIMETWLAKFRLDSTPACTHEQVTPSYEHVTCKKCGQVKMGNHSDTWGVAKDRWFNSLVEAEFYKKHGRLPEDG